jgi:hypothetical protein
MQPLRLLTVLLATLVAVDRPSAHAVVEDRPIVGKKLVLRRSSSGREKLSFAGGDPGEVTLAPFVQDGALVELFTPGAPAGVAMALPSSNWSVARQFVVRFGNRGAPNDVSPLSTAIVEVRRYLKVSGKDTGLALDAPLGRVGIRVTAGDSRWCALFTEAHVIADVPGRFSARRSPADTVPDCRADTLGGIGSPSGAFVGD